MAEFTLVVGNKVYSSWSLRGWLAARLAGIAFEERLVRLSEPGSRAALLAVSPAGKVPVLHHGARVIWDLLAIIEYLAEQRPAAGLWPEEPAARAHARSIAAEMHAGFARLAPPHADEPAQEPAGQGPGAGRRGDIERIGATLAGLPAPVRQGRRPAGVPVRPARAAADAMYAPVATRFRTYGVALDPVGGGLCRGDARLAACSASGRRPRSRSPGSSPRTRSTRISPAPAASSVAARWSSDQRRRRAQALRHRAAASWTIAARRSIPASRSAAPDRPPRPPR